MKEKVMERRKAELGAMNSQRLAFSIVVTPAVASAVRAVQGKRERRKEDEQEQAAAAAAEEEEQAAGEGADRPKPGEPPR